MGGGYLEVVFSLTGVYVRMNVCTRVDSGTVGEAGHMSISVYVVPLCNQIFLKQR